MKTAEDILLGYIPYLGSADITYANILKAMEEYASQKQQPDMKTSEETFCKDSVIKEGDDLSKYTSQKEQSAIQLVKQRIRVINGITMTEELFNRKSEEMATWMVDNLGMEIIDKLDIYALDKHWWQLEYVV